MAVSPHAGEGLVDVLGAVYELAGKRAASGVSLEEIREEA